ncbi:DUF2235 domain-containing protein [Aldersonia sp. NBC_00410]|uniref:DUF2235 domain-containing protein n=1 Tax=Aldersonia sp. NBC_00410 TaxID=2975954 RepID=UPI00225B8193|nr:DUF2235 domain-containing protein [Aldersonia sp. NBC_00410]MCX5045769.1 DUF2235 domain-containing protein [Aldersonia sp. NBC_00410]
MKRLVVCCDGTWKSAEDQYISNVEKIARAVRTRDDDGVAQIVHYVSGVGTGETRLGRLLAGATGAGLNSALLSAYRFLALNYEHGDQIYLFGFSRGAYTARSLAGMIGFNGLLTMDGVLAKSNPLSDALEVYRNRPRGDGPVDLRTELFRELTYQGDERPKITFLGVFDTVGALGVPGMAGAKFGFHNVNLSDEVLRARQALAIDEPRLKFTPAVWNGNGTTDLKQVWFDGDHTDVGGGHEDTTLSDETLRWIVREAGDREIDGGGLQFKFRAARPVRGPRPKPFDPLKFAYWFDNRLILLKRRWRKPTQPIRTRGSRRVLALSPEDVSKNHIYLANTALDNWRANTTRVDSAPNIGWWQGADDHLDAVPGPIEPDIPRMVD